MPERIAKTDASTNITEAIGSGPFKFVKEEWVPGSKVVYVKNADYVPRKEAPSWAAGGKVVKVDRVEWIYIPDSATAAAALSAGEVDWWEQLPPDLIPVLAKNKGIKVENIDPLGSMGMIRFNFLYPPFNNPKMRQALLYAVDQNDYVVGIAGDPKNGRTCYSYFTCGTPLSSEVGAERRMYLPFAALAALAVVGGRLLLARYQAHRSTATGAAAVRRGTHESASANGATLHGPALSVTAGRPRRRSRILRAFPTIRFFRRRW